MAAYKSSAQHLIYPEPAPRTRDHHKENLREIKQKQQRARQRKLEEAAQQQRPAFKDKAYANVKPRVDFSGHTANEPQPRKEFLRAGARKQKGPPQRPAKPYQPRRQTKHAPVPSAAEAARPALRKPHNGRNFEQQQREDLKKLAQRKQQEKARQKAQQRQPVSTKQSGQYGKVPEYLAQRRVELAEEKQYLQKITRQQVNLPTGWQEMPDEQRKAVLQQLQTALDQKSQALQRMPFLVEGVRRRREKAELEADIQECERSIKIFQDTVYIDPHGNLTNRAPQSQSADHGDRWERLLQ